jgi:hypothetical protein
MTPGRVAAVDVETFRSGFSLPIDRGIASAVKLLSDAGIETYESCEGGEGHAFTEPTIRFYGGKAEGYRAAGIALQLGLPVTALRRFWSVIDGELTGPHWELTFRDQVDGGKHRPPSGDPGEPLTS